MNNAGAVPGGGLQEIDEARWRQAWDLKVFGYINLTREIYKVMTERGRGVIVNILGTAGNLVPASYIVGVSGNASLVAFNSGRHEPGSVINDPRHRHLALRRAQTGRCSAEG